MSDLTVLYLLEQEKSEVLVNRRTESNNHPRELITFQTAEEYIKANQPWIDSSVIFKEGDYKILHTETKTKKNGWFKEESVFAEVVLQGDCKEVSVLENWLGNYQNFIIRDNREVSNLDYRFGVVTPLEDITSQLNSLASENKTGLKLRKEDTFDGHYFHHGGHIPNKAYLFDCIVQGPIYNVMNLKEALLEQYTSKVRFQKLVFE